MALKVFVSWSVLQTWGLETAVVPSFGSMSDLVFPVAEAFFPSLVQVMLKFPALGLCSSFRSLR